MACVWAALRLRPARGRTDAALHAHRAPLRAPRTGRIVRAGRDGEVNRNRGLLAVPPSVTLKRTDDSRAARINETVRYATRQAQGPGPGRGGRAPRGPAETGAGPATRPGKRVSGPPGDRTGRGRTRLTRTRERIFFFSRASRSARAHPRRGVRDFNGHPCTEALPPRGGVRAAARAHGSDEDPESTRPRRAPSLRRGGRGGKARAVREIRRLRVAEIRGGEFTW